MTDFFLGGLGFLFAQTKITLVFLITLIKYTLDIK